MFSLFFFFFFGTLIYNFYILKWYTQKFSLSFKSKITILPSFQNYLCSVAVFVVVDIFKIHMYVGYGVFNIFFVKNKLLLMVDKFLSNVDFNFLSYCLSPSLTSSAIICNIKLKSYVDTCSHCYYCYY